MPRAKRNKVLSLTKTPKRNTRSAKSNHIDAIQEAAIKYPTCVVFLMTNQRTSYLQEVRSLWKANSRMFVGKNRVVAKAIGVDEQSEVQPGMSGVSKLLQGPVGVLMTTSDPQEVLEWFQDYEREDFSRSGNVATQTVTLPAGPVMLSNIDPPETLPHSLEPQLRALGMPTELQRGVPTLLESFTVRKSGEKLTSEKAQILKHLLIKDAKFRLIPVAHWTKATERVEEFNLPAFDQEIVQQSRRAVEKVRHDGAVRGASKKVVAIEEDEMSQDQDDDDEEEMDSEVDDIEKRDAAMMMPVNGKRGRK